VLVGSLAGSERFDATVLVDARRSMGSNDRFWASAVFHPTEFLDTAWGREHLALLREGGVTLNYVRIYCQPEDAAYLRDDGSIGYKWDHFDRRADLILAQGCRLLVSFYSMPPQIAANPDTHRKRPFLDGKKIYIGPPKDYRQWQEACADFTRQVVARYGEDRVAQWRFTCWNEPDLAGFWAKGDLVEYRKLYDHFAAGVKSACARVPIGGPVLSGTHTFAHPGNYRDFLKHITSGSNHADGRTGSPIDYIAVHTYGGSGAAGSTYSKFPSVDYIMEQQQRLVAMRDEFPALRRVPLVVQEWGVTSSGATGMEKQPMAEVRNTPYAAAFLTTLVARQVEWRRSAQPGIQDLFICLSGYEVARKSDFEGKRTVQTRSGFDKPILNGYRLLARLGPEWVACDIDPSTRGAITALATRDGDRRVSILLTHFRPDQPQSEGATRTVRLRLAHLWPAGAEGRLRHWRIDGTHSNAYAVFIAEGRPRQTEPAQATRIKQRMGLEQLEPERTVPVSGPLELTVTLPVNAVSLLEFER
jgi:xylan 1,4-beta-xylosidase